ncbi:MAG: M50 family metallopeptidase [Christensenellaceae bacterium]
MRIFISIVVTLLVLTALVVAHEFGHYIVAKKRGIKVSEFAIGFGPKLIKWYRSGTEFSIRPFFIGGFVKFADDEEKEAIEGDFRAASLKSRLLTIIAGPLMNVLLAIVITAVMLMSFGDAVPVISAVGENTTAYEAGVMQGDVITNMNGVAVDFSMDMQDVYKKEKGDTLALTVDRNGEKIRFDIPYMEETADGQKLTGIQMTMTPKTYGFFEAIVLSFKWLFLMMREILITLGRLFFMWQGIENLTGIVGVVGVVGSAVQYGIQPILALSAMLSINLAIVNLLPIPALDGGKIVLYAVEGIRKKPASEKLVGILNTIGIVLIFGLSIYLIFQDIFRMVT